MVQAAECLPSETIAGRVRFLEDQVNKQQQVYNELKKRHDQADRNLRAMRLAHRISSVCTVISAAALIYVSGSIGVATILRGAAVQARVMGVRTIFATRSVATLLTSGETLAISPLIKGMTYFTISRSLVMLPLDGYMIYRDLFGDHENFGQSITPETIESLWNNSSTFPPRAHEFFERPVWNGYSTELENPKIERMIDSLNDFYQQKLAEIDNSDSFWDGLTEFWTKKQLREYALTKEVMAISMDIQRFRVAYFHMLLTRLRGVQRVCAFRTTGGTASVNQMQFGGICQ